LPTAGQQKRRGLARYRLLYVILALVLVLDQVTKLIVLHQFPEKVYFFDGIAPEPLVVIEGFFYIVHIWNPGAAWGILPGQGVLLSLLAVVALVGIFYFRRELTLERPYMQIAFGMLCGGIIGNLIDRLRIDHVVDFLDFHLPLYGRWPAFNIADMGITIGVALYMVASLREYFQERKKAKETPHKEA